MKQSKRRSFAINVTCSLAALLISWSLSVHAETTSALQGQLDNYPHTESVSTSQSEVRNYEIGLGAMEKFAGQWRFKHSERVTGVLQRNTWRLIDGYTSNEVLDEAIATLEDDEQHELLFSCDGRSCGQGVQWANRVFKERILYGREEMQRYRVYSLGSEGKYRVLLFSAARSAERQYLHMEILEVSP